MPLSRSGGCRILHKPQEDRGHLAPDGGAVRAQGGAGGAGHQALADRPAHGLQGVLGDAPVLSPQPQDEDVTARRLSMGRAGSL